MDYKRAEMATQGGGEWNLGCENEFALSDNSHFMGKSGGYVFRELSGFGYISAGRAIRGNEMLVVTRGTDTRYDVITDAQVAPVPWKNSALVHNGFKRVFDTYVDQLDDFMKNQCVSHVHCVGHSLGGALATLNADHIAHKYGVGVTLYTFGSPRVGHASFAQQLTRRIGPENIYRVAHSTDPVSMVPCLPFLHAPMPGGKNYTIRKNGFIAFNDHKIASYKDSVSSHADWGSLAAMNNQVAWDESAAKAIVDVLMKDGGRSIITPFHSASWQLLKIAIEWLLRQAVEIAGTVLGIAGTQFFTTLDLMCLLLSKAAQLCAKMGRYIMAVMNAVLRFIGEAVVWTGKKIVQAGLIASDVAVVAAKTVGRAAVAGAKATGDAAVASATAVADAAAETGKAVGETASATVDSLNAFIAWVFDKLNRKINGVANEAIRKSNDEQERGE